MAVPTAPTPRSKHPLRWALSALLTVVLLGAAPAAWGYWSASQQVVVTMKAAKLATPAPTCLPMPAVGLAGPYARVSWPTVPSALNYTVTVRNQAGATTRTLAQATTATTIDVNNTLLGPLLDALLGGTPMFIVVTANHSSGWVSEPSTGKRVVSAPGGLLGGLTCA